MCESDGGCCVVWCQGNLIIRGYVQRYNDPPVQAFISMHGPMMGRTHIPIILIQCISCVGALWSCKALCMVCVIGVAGLPGCNVSRVVCDEVDKLAAKGAYNDLVQQHLAQVHPHTSSTDLSQPPLTL